MQIPQYWSKAIAEQTDRKGRKQAFCCWRSSEESEADAHESALAAAKRVLERLAKGERISRYDYGETPLREEVVQRFTGPNDELLVAVTRNAFGALVLNAARVMFIDVDFPDVLRMSLLELVKSMFRRSTWSGGAAIHGFTALTRLKQFVGERPGWAVRAYRTWGGVRALVTHELFQPASEATQTAFAAVGADPMYVRLCSAQKCFRARLTPKPWRCRHFKNPIAWPREDATHEERFQEWLAAYNERQAAYATCRFIGTLGSDVVHPDVADIIEIHDKLTRCHEALRLA